MEVTIREADFANAGDCAGIVDVLNSYASDQIGGGQPLSAGVRERLAPGLRDHPTTLVLLAFVGSRPVGVAVCFFGFSTFQARPLLNIHDLAWFLTGAEKASVERCSRQSKKRPFVAAAASSPWRSRMKTAVRAGCTTAMGLPTL